VDLLLLTTINRINKVENLSFSPVPAPGEIERKRQIRDNLESYQVFKRVIQILLIMFDAEIAEFQSDPGNSNELEFVIAKNVPPQHQALEVELRTMLGLDPIKTRFRITSRTTGLRSDEISIQTRSLLATMLFLSKGVDVPSVDLTERHVYPVSTESANPQESIVPLHVRPSQTPPEEAFVAAEHRGNWFYVDNSDTQSKRMFTLLMFLFELQAPAGGGVAPLLTLPTG